MGGIVGIVLGALGAMGIGNAISINAAPEFGIVLFSFIFAAFIGIVFGGWPAYKASNLNPIEALRFD